MDATRPHLSFPAEWITAAIFLLATLAVGSLIVNELRVPALPAARQPAAVPAPTAVPQDAVAVPKLMLREGAELAVGQSLADAAAALDGATMAARSVERGPLGPREVRAYDLAGTRFIVVLEPFERQGAPRVSAIYLR